jgi:hypothetical protein
MPGFNPEDVLDRFEELIPNAAGHADGYLRAVVQGVRDQRVPVSADVRPEPLTGGWRAPKTDCLVLTPTESRLRHFEMLHYAIPIGRSLKVGYYLLGGVKAQGLGGWAILGGSNQMDMDNLQSLVQLIEECAVASAMHEVAGAVGSGPLISRPTQGFFAA